jgi:hypothetical protein
MKVRRTMFNETNQLDEILPIDQICLSVWCDALAPLINIIPLANHLFG